MSYTTDLINQRRGVTGSLVSGSQVDQSSQSGNLTFTQKMIQQRRQGYESFSPPKVSAEPVTIEKPQSRTEQVKGFLSKAYDYLWGDNEKVLQLSEDDLVKRIYQEQQSGNDTTKLNRAFQLVKSAREPDASPVNKYGVGLLMRLSRGGTQLVTGGASFASSVLDYVSQQTEQMIENDKEKAKRFEGTPMGDYYKAKLPKEGEDTTNWFRKKSGSLKKWVEDHSVSNPTFADMVSQGTASMAGFALMNFVGGAESAVVTESLIESANTYETLRNEGKSFEEATIKGDASLLANLVVNHFLNIFEMDEKQISTVRKVLEGATKEGLQEGLQQVISNLTTDRPIMEGVFESAGVGGVLGGGTALTLPVGGGQQMHFDEQTGEITETGPGELPPAAGKPEETKTMAKPEVKEVPIEQVQSGLPSDFVEKINRSSEKIQQMVEDIRSGQELPPVPVYSENGTYYTNKDGDNRLIAYQEAGVKTIPVEVQEKTTLTGTQKQAEERAKAEKVKNEAVTEPTQQTEQKTEQVKQQTEQKQTPSVPESIKTEVVKYKTASAFVTALQKKIGSVEFGDTKAKFAGLNKDFTEMAQQPQFQKMYDAGKKDADVLKAVYKQIKSEGKKVAQPTETTGKTSKKAAKTQKSPDKKPTKQPKTVKKKALTTNAPSDQDVADYVDKKGVKFRTTDTQTDTKTDTQTKQEAEPKVTLKFLEHPDIKGKDTAGYQFIENLSKSKTLNIKQKERELIQDVLVKNFPGQKQINMEEFRRALIGQLMPLEAIQTSTYADYGSDNLGGGYNTTTYILNSPYNHGVTGHFYSDFRKTILRDEVEAKEIPESAQNPRAKWAVVKKGVELTRENIDQNVLTVATTESLANKWIDDHVRGPESDIIEYNVTEGLFSHFRSFDSDGVAHIAEVQSDAFQHPERLDKRRDLEKQIEKRKASLLADINKGMDEGLRVEITNEIKDLEDQLNETPTLSPEGSQFFDYKNIWHERTVREAITIKAREGFDSVRFPTPRTVAVIEGFSGGESDNMMPYEVLSANDEEQLEPGDEIDYGGETMTVVEADRYQIKVAPSDRVNNFLDSEFRDEEANARMEDLEYEWKNFQDDWGEINTPEKARFVLDSVSVLDQLTKYTNKKEALKYATDTTQQSAERVAEIKAWKSPDPKLLKGIPKSVIERAKKSTWGYSLGEERMVLDRMAEQEEGEYTIDDFADEIRESYFEQEPDYEGIFSEVYFEDNGGDTRIWTVDGHTETFQQPNEYDEAKSIEDFDIEDYSGEQRTVLDFYDKQLNRYVQKLRRGNLELVTDDNGYQWYETKVTKDDIRPPTAYRIQEDLAKVGITITPEQEQEILALNKQIFGDTNVKVVTQILANQEALGAYSDRIIRILDKQADPTDTYYHEAVHKYLDIFTTRDEYIDILKEGRDRYQLTDLSQVEEKIAEDFIDYANRRKGVTGKLKTYFDKILARFKSYMGSKSSIDALYADIISGRGRVRASKVAVSIEQKVKGAFDNVAGYEQINVKDQAKRASELITSDIDRVRRIVSGELPLPDGLRAGMLIKGVEEYALATDDIDLLRSLAVSPLVAETSVHAQELRLLAERDENSVLSRVQDLASARAKVVEKRYGTIEKAVKQEVEKIKKEVKVSKYDWNSFINSIEC